MDAWRSRLAAVKRSHVYSSSTCTTSGSKPCRIGLLEREKDRAPEVGSNFVGSVSFVYVCLRAYRGISRR